MGDTQFDEGAGAYAPPAHKAKALQQSRAPNAGAEPLSRNGAGRKPVPKPRASLRLAQALTDARVTGNNAGHPYGIAASNTVKDVINTDVGTDLDTEVNDAPAQHARPLYTPIRKFSSDSGYPSDPSLADSDNLYSSIDEPVRSARRAPGLPLPPVPTPVPSGSATWISPLARMDVGVALATLAGALDAAAPMNVPGTGAPPKRRGPTLGNRCERFYRALGHMAHKKPASMKQTAKIVVGLSRHAAVEGYAALEQTLIGETLKPRLHILTLDELCTLARLADRNDKTRQDLAREIAQALGTDKRRSPAKTKIAGVQQDVAEALLTFVGELAKEHAIAKAWDTRIAVLLDAAHKGAQTDIDAALQDMWSGDEALGDPARPRRNRLLEYIGRLHPDQRRDLGRMLNVPTPPGALQRDATAPGRLPHNFGLYETVHMRQLQTVGTMRHQMRKYLQDLRAAVGTATRNDQPQARAVHFVPGAPEPDTGKAFPPRIQRQLGLMTRLRRRLAALFSRRATTTNDLKTQVRAAVSNVLQHGGLTQDQSTGLTQAIRNVVAKRGESHAANMLGQRISESLDKLDPGQLSILRQHVAQIASSASLNQIPRTHPLRHFHAGLARALDQEPGIRHCANALTILAPALRNIKRPDALLRALDALADAQLHLTGGQSELDLYEAALARLDPSVRANMRKRLNGRDGVARHAAAIDRHSFPSRPWSRYRRHQLDVLARSVAA
jgi:hypothetical protein